MLGGCETSLDWSLPNEALKLQWGDETCSILPSSRQFKALSNWLAQNQTGWSSSPASYMPAVVVTGSNFSVNFLGSMVVVNYPGGQFTRKVSPNEYAFLTCNTGT